MIMTVLIGVLLLILKVVYEADDSDEQIESAAGDLVKCNGISKMEMRVRVMRCCILKGTQR